MTDNSVVAAPEARFWSKIWRLTWPYFRSEEWRSAWVLLIAVVSLNLSRVYLGVLLNDWNREFFNALQQKDLTPTAVKFAGFEFGTVSKFVYLIGQFTLIVAILIIVFVYGIYLAQMLELRWRRWMTYNFMTRWLGNRTHYRLQLLGYGADNPEQRIQEDVDRFTTDTIDLLISLMRNIINLITFIIILWTISGSVSFMLGQTEVTVPGYMVWIVIVYALAGTLITFWIGIPLVRANFDQQRFNADFRFRMTRIRENSESIALYAGEAKEETGLRSSFLKVWNNTWLIMIISKRLNWFYYFYDNLTTLFPYLVTAPRYFSGAIDFGTVFQVANAFNAVQNSLSWFITFFQNLAIWKATTNRLVTFVDALERAEADARHQTLEVEPQASPALNLAVDDIAVPTGRTLMQDVNIEISRGDKILISGPSGSGKTTLFRVLAGLWPFAKGKLRIPKGARVLFLSQKPYLPLGTLRDVVAFPSEPGTFTDEQIKNALAEVRLPHLIDHLDEDQNWSMTLSVGEQQRVAIARALLNKPDWLFMDEATSALDDDNERHVYDLITQRLAQSAIVSIAHRPSVAAYHHRRLAINPELQEVQSVSLAPAE
ncbi:MAG TPA: ABC transporter ATP-binding protein/permease [Dongiaceae bacterium]|jgi:putative ATP-binding cassette transporter|nr:ABC transporter ATP-binding protein/permease [Dongiaceae bacterium]